MPIFTNPRSTPCFSMAPTQEDFEAIATEALATIPEEFRRHVGNVRIQIDDFPSDEVEKEMELDTPFDLLGLYQGTPLTEQQKLSAVLLLSGGALEAMVQLAILPSLTQMAAHFSNQGGVLDSATIAQLVLTVAAPTMALGAPVAGCPSRFSPTAEGSTSFAAQPPS